MAVTHHGTATVEGRTIFYRDAGPVDAQVIVLRDFLPGR